MLKKLLQVIDNEVSKKNNALAHKNDFSTLSDEEKVSNIVAKSEEIVKQVCSYSDTKYTSRTKKIDKILTSKKFGIPIMLLFLAVILWITIAGANYPSSLLSSAFSFLQDKLLILLTNMHVPEFITNILIYRCISDRNLGCLCYAASNGYILSIIYIT